MSSPAPLLQRHLVAELQDALAAARVVNLVGPRQVGKTTLVRDLFPHSRFVTLDDAGTLAALSADPIGQLEVLTSQSENGPVVIDEAQRAPGLALAIKQIV
ncbi:MAG: AAA family ATPase, partial [Hyphomonadaceae bacterium]|nr:AAA family ATPase [Hyphomonadaceae bacterium]